MVVGSEAPIDVLEEKHAISTMIYRMPEKLDMLENRGLIVQMPINDHNSVNIHLTDMGKDVAMALRGIASRMTQ